MMIHSGKTYRAKPFPCNICGKDFANQKFLSARMWRTHGEFNYTCSKCWEGFPNSLGLITHMRTHEDSVTDTGGKPKPYTCKICEREFNNQNNLTSHMKIHSKKTLHLQRMR